MITLDSLLPIVGVAAWLLIITVVAAAGYRRVRPYKVVGHSPSMGMVAVRWRDDPAHTHWLTPSHLDEQKGSHR